VYEQNRIALPFIQVGDLDPVAKEARHAPGLNNCGNDASHADGLVAAAILTVA
jgi:hypothetical protein